MGILIQNMDKVKIKKTHKNVGKLLKNNMYKQIDI